MMQTGGLARFNPASANRDQLKTVANDIQRDRHRLTSCGCEARMRSTASSLASLMRTASDCAETHETGFIFGHRKEEARAT